MQRTMAKEKYIVAALITAGVFIMGLLLGLVIEGKRADYVTDVAKEHELSYNSLQLQYVYVDQLGKEGNCPAVLKTLEKDVTDLVETANRLEEYEKDSTLKKDDFNYLKRQYMLDELRYWLFAKKAREICGGEYKTVLYFYSTEKECPDCEEQAFILTYLKMAFKDNLLNFAIDGGFENEPLIQILKSTYNIKKYPSLVVENKVFEGFATKEDLLKEVCSGFSKNTLSKYEEYCS